MKTDLMIVPSDTFELIDADLPWVPDPHDIDLRVPPPLGVFTKALNTLYLSAHCSQGPLAYAKGCGECSKHGACDGEAVVGPVGTDPDQAPLRLGPPLLARPVAGRVEPLYPAGDDLVIDDRHKDSIFAQASFLEPLRGDFVRHDLTGLRLLVASSRHPRAPRLGAYLTRKGVKVWSERKPERLAEGEHYVLARRLFEIERHPKAGGDGAQTTAHVRLRSGVGMVVSVEVPEGRPPMPLPSSIPFGPGGRVAYVEEVQIPQTDLRLKSGRRWRLCCVGPMTASAAGLPAWIDESERTTRAPFPVGGKLFAVAARRDGRRIATDRQRVLGGPACPVIPAGATFFVEFNEPVRVDASNWILAGGY